MSLHTVVRQEKAWLGCRAIGLGAEPNRTGSPKVNEAQWPSLVVVLAMNQFAPHWVALLYQQG